MKSFFQSKPAALTSAHEFTTPFNVESPVPARRRSWLRGREFVQPWQDERILTSSYFIDPIPGALPNIAVLLNRPGSGSL
jgi:hypothetical protein